MLIILDIMETLDPPTPPVPAPPPGDQILTRLGNALRITRVRHNLTLDELARRIGTHRQVLGDMEHGKGSSSLARWLAAFEALGSLDAFARLADDLEGIQTDDVRRRRRVRGAPEFEEPF